LQRFSVTAPIREQSDLHGLGESLVRVRHHARSGNVAGFHLDDVKSRSRNKFVNLTIEVATASDALPEWRDPILPLHYRRIGSAAMFEKNEPATGS
jgi:hypothetical protein